MAEAESPLSQASGPLDEGGAMLLPIKQAAAHLGLSYSSLIVLPRAGALPVIRAGPRPVAVAGWAGGAAATGR